ncbi:MAG TPA: DUF501 domain-containing protein [Candidatus Rifleibacterium sp.]|nr:DUF501 domain-containing protein [Candidatus Rifleibacterium sp.]HPT45185.1 DUF501 domain-containing protein [Candidatus Rifleibacterium sp.]
MANINSEATGKEYQNAVKLLGREPRTPFLVKTRCPDGSPQVLVAEPVFLEDGIWKPFPAFIWLVCPRLKQLVAVLEQQGYVRSFSARLEEDADFRDKFLSGQVEIAAIRVEMAEKVYPGELPEHIREVLGETTVAGSRDFRGVKCLHAHLAHELAYGGNPIGAEVLKMIGNCSPADDCGSILYDGGSK